jgi:hypothetical protein
MIRTRYSGEDDYLYYDISIFNNSESNIPDQFPLSFIETRPENFIERSQDFYLSVVRFNLVLANSLPVFIPKIQSNQENRNKTIYKIILRIGANNYLLDIYWQPQNILTVYPKEPVIFQEYSDYYFCNSYSHFLRIMNKLILDKLVEAGSSAVCYFQLNPSTNNIELITTEDFFSPTPTVAIGFNEPLKNLFSTFSFNVVPTPVLFSSTYEEPYYYNIETSEKVVYNATAGTFITSTYTCPLAPWNPVASIVFTSATLPVIPNAVGPEKLFNTNIVLPSQQNSNNVLNVITDFEVDIGPNSFYAPSVSYLPTAQYRLISLYGSGGIDKIQMNIYWKDNYGGLHLIYLPNNCIGNIKLMFVKKTAQKF